MGLVVFYIIFWSMAAVLATGFLASYKKREVGVWIVISFIIGWIAFIILACLEKGKKCSYCNALNSNNDILCRDCGRKFIRVIQCFNCGNVSTLAYGKDECEYDCSYCGNPFC